MLTVAPDEHSKPLDLGSLTEEDQLELLRQFLISWGTEEETNGG